MDISELLEKVVELISEQFGFYQAGIFFVDEKGENAVLQAASSDGGKRMLARGHRLKVGEQGIVGYVTRTGLPRIALDVGDDAVHFNTPELPQTRSEMALPLFVGGRVLGALDVQSVEERAFTEDDVSALTVLADQVSMAINNARLFQDLQARIESERQAYGEFSREAWRNLVRHTGRMEYKFSDNKLTTPNETWPEEMTQAMKLQEPVISDRQDHSLSVPLTISGQAVGAIRVQKSTALDWNNDEIDLIQTLTERLSQALESARLYRTSQQQAMQEQLTSSISARLRQTLDIDTVLKTAAKELGDAFNAKEVVIRMAANEPGN
jgi:GAF domain-containing protein